MTMEELPEVLEVADIQCFLGISQSAAYGLVKSKAFHVVKIGRIYKVPKKSFIAWFEGQKIS
ncbi:helix-turn-helix domain-containing protein [Paenibacillus frigoriresistens]|uniref:helix-turn-helix domain-containing protein n=1 Tax=Paenibacillus alginolyticus TaxID=59839 RepID=UPI0015633821|nr:helix-turn-helix domain-containing protein [Paenibacillus frigoriresistens]NRF91486.1 helix-turn-helix domain-containing protein [Paenibacillus frigoriresistens]